MAPGLQLVTDQQLKHQQNEVQGETYKHSLVVNVSFTLQSAILNKKLFDPNSLIRKIKLWREKFT